MRQLIHTSLRSASRWLRWATLSLLASEYALAAMSATLELSGQVTDFDERYVVISATTERYRVERAAVPDALDLRPGSQVTFELPADAVLILPMPIAKTAGKYKPPRKRVPAAIGD